MRMSLTKQRRWNEVAAALDAVPNIVYLRPGPEVIRANARRIVTGMQREQTRRDVASRKREGQPVCLDGT